MNMPGNVSVSTLEEKPEGGKAGAGEHLQGWGSLPGLCEFRQQDHSTYLWPAGTLVTPLRDASVPALEGQGDDQWMSSI